MRSHGTHPVTITPCPDGPLLVRGAAVVPGPEGDVATTRRTVALCRCGGSAIAPFCDGTHKLRRRDAG